MKGQKVRLAVAMLLVFGLSAANAGTQATNKTTKPSKTTKPEVKTYTGTVKVTKDKAGQITDVKLSGGILSKKYSIILDNEGKELATKMAGKKVQVKGLLEKKSGKTVLLVKQYGPVPAKSSKKVVATKPATTTTAPTTTTPAPR